jgi:hypothetical protein
MAERAANSDWPTAGLIPLVAFFALMTVVCAALFVAGCVLEIRAQRRTRAVRAARRTVVPPPQQPTTVWQASPPVQPRGAQDGRHRAERLDWDTVPISMASIERARAARGAR